MGADLQRRKERSLRGLGSVAAILLVSLGTGLLYESISDNSQTTSGLLLLGASLFTAGILTMFLIAQSRWREMRATMQPPDVEPWERPKRTAAKSPAGTRL